MKQSFQTPFYIVAIVDLFPCSRPPLTAAELVVHPAFKTVTWDLLPTKYGKVPVAQGRGGPIRISYEVHGTGNICLVVSLL